MHAYMELDCTKTEKLDIKKNDDPMYKMEVYSGTATRSDGKRFAFDIYCLPVGGWNAEYSIYDDKADARLESGIKDFETMLDAFIWASDFYKQWDMVKYNFS